MDTGEFPSTPIAKFKSLTLTAANAEVAATIARMQEYREQSSKFCKRMSDYLDITFQYQVSGHIYFGHYWPLIYSHYRPILLYQTFVKTSKKPWLWNLIRRWAKS